MLPGFRILFALVVLSVAILIFGFGALALLRTAHQNLASQPTWQPNLRAPVELANAQRNERQQALSDLQTLAMLRVEPPMPQPATSVDGPTDAAAAQASMTEFPSGQGPSGRSKPIDAQTATPDAATTTAANGNDTQQVAALPAEPINDAADRAGEPRDPTVTTDPRLTTAAPEADAKPTSVDVTDTADRTAQSLPIVAESGAPQTTSPSPSAGEVEKAAPTAPAAEPSIRLAALPDAATSAVETRPEAGKRSARQSNAADLRAKRRARARLRARRLALARARAARLAQTQQAASATQPYYNGGFTTTTTSTTNTSSASSASRASTNTMPFGSPYATTP